MATYKGFTHVKLRKPQRSKFDLSHEKKLSTRMGKLVPIFVTEVLPNDTIKINCEVMLRFAPLLAPLYHRVNVFVHHFFVPNRICDLDWENFITNGRLGDSNAQAPYFRGGNLFSPDGTISRVTEGSLADFMGMAPISPADYAAWNDEGSSKYRVNARPFLAYQKIWMDYYRDRNYVDDGGLGFDFPGSFGGNIDDNNIVSGLLFMRNRSWQHDYFTSALPWTQRGDEVLMPMEGDAAFTYLQSSQVKKSDGTNVFDNTPLYGDSVTGDLTVPASVGPTSGRIENLDTVTFSNGTITINDLRQAARLQEWLERNAVAGSRYNESIMAHFARRTSDGRLQRAEYLGGGRVNVQISEVMTTAYSEDGDGNTIPPANMTGRGISYAKNNRIVYNCEEHGFVMSIMSVMPVSGYMQGAHRMLFSRDSFLDYPWPAFANLGEQAVYDYEIYQQPSTLPDHNGVDGAFEEAPIFGYQSRYADWKYMYSTVHGDFRSNLDFWHLNRKFASLPVLGANFVTFEDSLQNRVFAVSNVDTLWCYVYNNCSVVRSLPYFGTPTL